MFGQYRSIFGIRNRNVINVVWTVAIFPFQTGKAGERFAEKDQRPRKQVG